MQRMLFWYSSTNRHYIFHFFVSAKIDKQDRKTIKLPIIFINRL